MYNLASRRWLRYTPSSQCDGSCIASGVGSHWVKLGTSHGCEQHCGWYIYLQSISTGKLIPDPVTPGGTTFDDLNAPSGAVSLCFPLRYPQNYYPMGPGPLQFSGPFALASENRYSQSEGVITVYHLKRCGSHLSLTVPEVGTRRVSNPPFLTSRAVIFELAKRGDSHPRLAGRYLPSLRPFTAALPKAPGAYMELVAATQRMLYAQNQYHNQLWAARLATPETSSHH